MRQVATPQPPGVLYAQASSPGAGPSTVADDTVHAQSKTFRRLRTSLEHTIRVAAGSKTRSHPQQPTASPAPAPAPSSSSHVPSASIMAPRKLRHKPSASDSNIQSSNIAENKPKGKQRVSVDFVGLERTKERERVEEKENLKERASRFSVGVGGGLRKLESKVGLRRLSSRETTNPSRQQQQAVSASSSTPLAPTRSNLKQSEHDHEDVLHRTRKKSAWSFLAPTLSAKASASTTALDTESSGFSHQEPEASTPPPDAASGGGTAVSKPRLITSTSGAATSTAASPSPTSPKAPSRSSTTRSRAALTSPSTPSLSSPSTSTYANPSLIRQRPSPIAPSSSSHAPPLPSLTTKNLSRSNTTPTPPAGRSVPPSPTTPSRASSQTQTQTQHHRTASPTTPAALRQSRPPLSPSAIVNSPNRARVRQPSLGTTARNASTGSLPSDAHTSSPVVEKPPRPERSSRRSSLDADTPTSAKTGRTTPTSGMPSHAAPTSSSRARANSARGQSMERERSRQREQLSKSKASASTTSLALAHGDRPRSPSVSGAPPGYRAITPISARPTSPAVARTVSPIPALRDTIRHASALLLRELNGPRPRSPSSSQPITNLQSIFPMSASAPVISDREGLTSEAWDECDARLRLLARSEKMRVGGPYGGSTASLVNTGTGAGGSAAAGEERERRIFAEALRDGYVLCQLANKMRPGVILRADAREDGFKTASNATKFLAAAAGAFNLPPSELFQRDDLIKGTPEALFRVARTVVAVVARAGEDAEADRIARKILLGGGGNSSDRGQPTNSPYGTRGRAASSSTPNLSTLQRSASPPTLGLAPKKRWSPPSPALSTVVGEDTASGSGTPAPLSRASSSRANLAREKDAMHMHNSSSSSGKTAGKAAKVLEHMKPHVEDESALDTDSEDEESEDSDEVGKEGTEKNIKAAPQASSANPTHAISPPIPIRASLASETTQSTTPSSLMALGRPGDSLATGVDRMSNQFSTMRTATTMATSFAPSEYYRADVSQTASDASTSAWLLEELSASSAPSSSGFSPLIGKKPQLLSLRDRRLSEAGMNNDLTRVAEETEEGTVHRKALEDAGKEPELGRPESAGRHRSRPQAIQLGKGKWPDDFIDAFKPGSPPRLAPRRVDAEHTREALPAGGFSSLAADLGANESNGSPSKVPPRRPLHRPRHSIDVPALRPKEVLPKDRDGSPGQESISRIIPRRNSSHTRALYVPRSDSASPSPSPPDANAATTLAQAPISASPNVRVPFPRAFSSSGQGQDSNGGSPATPPTGPEVAATTAAATAAQQNRFTRGRFQSEIDASTRRKPRPNSFEELGGRAHRSRIESMVSIGGASSSNFSASDIRSSMDGSAVRKTLIIRDEGKPITHFQLGNCIGRGQFGSVYRALNLNTGQMVAVKRIRLEGISEDEVKQLMKEVDVVKSLSHPSIVKYEGMSRDSDTLNIVLEYAENGSLGQILRAFGGRLNERLVATYVIKILEGLDYLHRNEVVHCDLKAANILTTKTGNVKLSDFGVSLNLRKVGGEHKTDVTGTPNWMAPEVIELKGASRASDIWSLGCTVIELLTGKPPYAEITNGMSVMYRIVDDPMPPIPEDWSPKLKNFLEQCFRREPSDRPSAEDLFEHDWLREHCEVHKVIRQKESIPFLRRVSQDLQQRPNPAVEAVKFAELQRKESRSSESPKRRSDERAASPLSQALVIPASPERRASGGIVAMPATPKSQPSESPMTSEHSFVKTAFGKPIPCRVCLQPVKKNAVVCEECALIAHSRCAPNAPPTCILRAQLLEIANSSPAVDSPDPMEIIRQFTPSNSPISDSVFQTPTAANDGAPPTAFRMFGAFRRSRSSLSPAPTDSDSKAVKRLSQTSQDASSESVLTEGQAQGSPKTHYRPQRPKVLVKNRPRPLSISGDASTPTKRGSQRSSETNGDTIDLSDDSYSQAHSNLGHSNVGHSQQSHSNSSYTRSRSQLAIPSPTQVLALSHSRSHTGRGKDRNGAQSPSDETEFGLNTDLDPETETENDGRYGPNSRLSLAVSAADSADPRRASVLAGSSVGGYDYDDEVSGGVEGLPQERLPDHIAWRSRARSRREEKDKNCIVQ